MPLMDKFDYGRIAGLNRAATGALLDGCWSRYQPLRLEKIPEQAGGSIFYGPMVKPK
jgi:hypothetical protein